MHNRNRLTEEELAINVDLVQMYNDLNKQYFGSFLPKGVPYNKSDSYGKYSLSGLGTVGITTSRKSHVIGDAMSTVNYVEDKIDVNRLRISKQFDFTPYDIATASDGNGTLMGIMLHEMCHFLVSLEMTNIRAYRIMKDSEGAHGSTFKNAVSRIQKKLDANGINIKIPAEESSVIERNRENIQTTIIIGVTGNRNKGFAFMSKNNFIKNRDSIIAKYHPRGDIFVWETTSPDVLNYTKAVKVPFSGLYAHNQVDMVISDSATTQIETIWKD